MLWSLPGVKSAAQGLQTLGELWAWGEGRPGYTGHTVCWAPVKRTGGRGRGRSGGPGQDSLELTCLTRILAVSRTVSEGFQFSPNTTMGAHSSLCSGQSSLWKGPDKWSHTHQATRGHKGPLGARNPLRGSGGGVSGAQP